MTRTLHYDTKERRSLFEKKTHTVAPITVNSYYETAKMISFICRVSVLSSN